MSTGPASASSAVTRPPTLPLAVIGAIASVVVVLVAGQRSAGIDGATIAFAFWAAVPFLLLAALAVLVRRRFPRGQVPLFVAGVAALVVGIVAAVALLGVGDEPAPLVIIWSPLVQEALVAAGTVAAVLLHRRAAR